MDPPTRSLQISFGPTVQQQETWAVWESRLLSDGQTTELRIHIYPFDDEKGPCFDLDECIVYRSSPQFMPRFTIYSTRKGHSQNAVHSSLTVTLLSPSGVLWWPRRVKLSYEYWCLGSFVWQHYIYCFAQLLFSMTPSWGIWKVKFPNAQRCFSYLHGNLLSLENGHFTLEAM